MRRTSATDLSSSSRIPLSLFRHAPGCRTDSFLENLHVILQPGQALADVVMKLARDSRTLLFLGTLDRMREESKTFEPLPLGIPKALIRRCNSPHHGIEGIADLTEFVAGTQGSTF